MKTRRSTENRTTRLSFDISMLLTAIAISQMSTCTRRAVGCVLTRDNFIVATGYNGSPKGEVHCLERGCLMGEHGGCIRTIHAEANACIRLNGTADTAWCTDQPCATCYKLLAGVGVKRIFYIRPYDDTERESICVLNKNMPEMFAVTDATFNHDVCFGVMEFLKKVVS
jgi:dCMP deaminase